MGLVTKISHTIMFLFLWIILCGTEASTTEPSPLRPSARSIQDTEFVSDFVDFYSVRFLTLLVSNDDALDSWSTQLAYHMMRHHNIYTTILTKEKLSSPGNKDYLQVISSLGLAVARLKTEEDLRVFVEVFTVAKPYLSWLLIGDQNFPEMLKGVFLPLDSKVTIAIFDEDTGSFLLFETYQIAKGFSKRTFRIGDWTPRTQSKQGLLVEGKVGHEAWSKRRDIRMRVMRYGVMRGPIDDPLKHREDLSGMHLRCVTMEDQPLTVLKGPAGGVVAMQGILASLMEELAARTNVTYTCKRSRDGQWGAVVDGKWTGVVRDLLEDVADIGAAGMDITMKRSEAVSYLTGVVSSGYRIFMKKPTNDDYMWSVYTKQFSVDAWAIVGGFVVILVVLLYLVTRFSPLQETFSFVDSASVIIGFVVAQGTSMSLESTSCRLVISVSLMLQVLLLSYYTSDLTSSLTAGPSPPKLSNLYDVYMNPRLKLGFEKGAAPHLYFSESTDPIIQKLWQRIVDNNYDTLMGSLDAGMQRVLKEPYLHMGWGIPMQYGYGGDCRLYMLPTSYFHVQASFMLRRKSPLVPVLNKVVMDIMSTGLLKKWWREWSKDSKNCGPLQNEAVGLKAVFGPFFALSLGLGLSILLFVFEVFISRKKAAENVFLR